MVLVPFQQRKAKTLPRGSAVGMLASGAAAIGAGMYRNYRSRNAIAVPRKAKAPVPKKRLLKKRGNLRKQVKQLQRKVNNSEGTLHYMKHQTYRVLAGVNTQGIQEVGQSNISDYETVLAQLRFFDSATPGTLVQASGATATYAREYLINYYVETEVKNNYQIPVEVAVYNLVPKVDTSITPFTAYVNGLADVGNPTNTDPMLYPTHSPQFNDLWKIEKSVKKTLMPGQKCMITQSKKDIAYDPSLYDSQTQVYQKRFKTSIQYVRVQGVLAHDTTANEQGLAACGVDIKSYTKWTVKYDAGIELEYIYLENNLDSFTNGAVVSSMPVADNIGYSVA